MKVSVCFGTWRDYDQYYMTEVSTTFFYDHFSTLTDEVSHAVGASLLWTHRLSCGGSNTLGWEEIVGYVGGITFCAAFVDGVILEPRNYDYLQFILLLCYSIRVVCRHR